MLDEGEERDQRSILRRLVELQLRAQRLRVRPQQVPRARRHDRGLPGLRGARGAHPALRRRGRAHVRGRPAHRRGHRGARLARAVPRVALHHRRGAPEGGDRRHRDRAGRAARRARERRASCSRRSGCACAPRTTSRCCARSGAARASRTTRCTSTVASATSRRTRCSTTSPTTGCACVDESHVAIPQLHGQFEGDRSRKETLVEHGFRLPSAMDNRPLRFEEFTERVNQVVFLSATPGQYEREISTQIVEQVVRPTGLIDPEVIVKPTKGQIDDLVAEINLRTEADQRVLVTTLTKKMSEDLTDYLLELGHPRALPALRDRHARAHRDPAFAAARRVRRARRHQPAARGPRPSRGRRWSRSSTPTRRASCARRRR